MTSRDIVVDIPEPADPVLTAPLEPSFDYTRSTGPVLGGFLTGLRDGRVLGIRDSSGAVHVPPVEVDPHTRDMLAPELVEVSPTGTVTSWTWVSEPAPTPDGRPAREAPHALALVRFDGADTAMLLPLDAAGPDEVHTGLRVRIRWAGERVGSVHDIVAVVPDHGTDGNDDEPTPSNQVSDPAGAASGAGPESSDDPVKRLVTPIALSVTHSAGPAESVFLRGLTEARLVGRRRSNGPEVYIPPRDYCPSDGEPMGEFVEVSDHGTVTTFGIVNVPFAGQSITPPYVTAYILLDGADLPIQHLVLGCEAAEVRMGLRVKAVWAPGPERPASMRAITHFEPSGEPDADPDSYAHHL